MHTRGTISDLPLFAAIVEPLRPASPSFSILGEKRGDGFPTRDICGGRHGGAITSRLAQLDRADRAAEQRARVHQAILAAGSAGLTVDELAAAWDQPPNRISGRFTELKAAGLLELAGHRRTRAGSAAGAWRVNAAVSQSATSADPLKSSRQSGG